MLLRSGSGSLRDGSMRCALFKIFKSINKKHMELVLTRIAKKRGYTIGRIGILSSPEAPLSSPEGDTIAPTSANKTIEAPSGAVGGLSATPWSHPSSR